MLHASLSPALLRPLLLLQGTHDELLAREGGAYRTLALQQEPTLLQQQQQLEAPPAAAAPPLPAQSEPAASLRRQIQVSEAQPLSRPRSG